MREKGAAPARRLAVLATAAAAAFGAAHVLVRTSTYGAAVGNDSHAYLVRSLDFMAGGGDLHGVQPPTFSLLLAFTALVSGAEPAECARWINAAAFGATIWVSGSWLQDRLRSRLLAAAATAALAVSIPLTDIASWVMTDALCVLFAMVFLTQIDAFLRRRGKGGGRSLAFAAAGGGGAAAMRYVGVTAVLAGVLLLLLDQKRRAAARLRNAVVFGAAASAPLAALLANNWAHTGYLAGSARHYRSGQSILDSLSQAGRVLGEWAAPAGAALSLAGLAAAAALAALLTAAVAARRRRAGAEGPETAFFVPSIWVFVVLYTAFLAAVAPFASGQGIDSRYLAPIHAPLALALAAFLDRLAAVDTGRRYAAAKWVSVFALLAAVLAHAGLSARSGAAATRAALEHGYAGRAYNTAYWENFSLFRYFEERPGGVRISDNSGGVFEAAFDRSWLGKGGRGGEGLVVSRIPYGGIGDFALWLAGAPEGSYVVWFNDFGYFGNRFFDYAAADLRCLPGLKPVEETPDGLILRVDRGHAPDCPPRPEGGEIVQLDFAVRLDGGFVTYTRRPCAPEDTRARFFLHLVPRDVEDLPAHRREHGFDNLDFDFDRYGARSGDGCSARVPLPDYPAARLTTGQFSGGEAIWRGEYALPDMARRSAGSAVGRPYSPRFRRSGGIRPGERYSAASRRVPPSQAVTTSSAMAPGGSSEIPTSVHVG